METARKALVDAAPVRIAHHPEVQPDGLLLRNEVADKIGDEILKRLQSEAVGTVVVVDLKGVETRASCAARFLGKPLAAIKTGSVEGRYLVLVGVEGENDYDVRRGLEDEQVVAVVRGDAGPRLLGKVDAVVEETYEYLARYSEVSSAMLVDPFDLKITAANARISKLATLGLLHRLGEDMLESGGRRYLYVPVR